MGYAPEEEEVGEEKSGDDDGDAVDGEMEGGLAGVARVAEEEGDIDADGLEIVDVEAEEPDSCSPGQYMVSVLLERTPHPR